MPAMDPLKRRVKAGPLDLRSPESVKARQPLPERKPRVRQPLAPPVKPAAIPPRVLTEPAKKAAPWWSYLQYPAIMIAAILAAYSTKFGQWMVLGFVVLAVVTRRKSQLTFGVALFLLITIPLFQLIGQTGIAQNTAVYVFELLVFGVGQAIWENRKMS